MKKIDSAFSEKNIHKTFLVLAVFLGVLASLIMPIFNDPDGQYHVAITGKMAGINIDQSGYGETEIGSGMYQQRKSYQKGFHLEKYYFTKYETTSFDKLPRDFDFNYKNYVFWGHIIPAIGMKVGSFVYPSMGVVVSFGRLFSVLVCYIALYFIIKYLKAGKLIFVAVSLSPVWLNQIASLSYDASSYVVVAWFIMLVVNTVYDKKVTNRRNILFFIASLLLGLVAKKNFYLLLLLLPVIYTAYPNEFTLFEKIRLKLRSFIDKVNSQKLSLKVIEGSALILLILFLADRGSKPYGGVVVAIKRIIRTHIFNDLNWWPDMSWLVSPYPYFNHMPVWVYGMWYAIFVLILIYSKRFIDKKSIPVAAAVVFIANLLGVYYRYLGYSGALSGFIRGTQGRYFSPLLLLFVLIAGSKVFPEVTLSKNSSRVLLILLFLLIIGSDVLLIFNTIYALMA